MFAPRLVRLAQALAIPLGFVALTGCGSGTGTVSGTVSYLGKPLMSGSVVLYCEDRQIVRGVIVDGRYSIPNVPHGAVLVTVQGRSKSPTGLRLQQNLPPITDGPVLAKAASSDQDELVPQRYSQPEESGLAVNVDSRHVVYEIDLTP